jgi:hypothetical protein
MASRMMGVGNLLFLQHGLKDLADFPDHLNVQMIIAFGAPVMWPFVTVFHYPKVMYPFLCVQ